ncbi:MAG TPA: zinc ribbon domain-containing protein [Candidatus Mediterraneibacter pullistercoris]|nr:zinc ribbon domain-containing protein [Candidatus Mediterraneibacter pullistercoris]
MKCIKCGRDIPDDSLFCPECGAKQEAADIRIQTKAGINTGWLKIVLPVIAVLFVAGAGIILYNQSAKSERTPETSGTSGNAAEMSEEDFIQNSKQMFLGWSNKFVNETSSLTVNVECLSVTDAELEDVPLAAEASNYADIYFSGGNVHLLGQGNSSQHIDQAELFLRGQTLEGGGDGEVNRSASTEVYVAEDNNGSFWQQENNSGYVEKEANESGIISLSLYLGFIDSISDNLDSAQIQKADNGDAIEIKGTIPGKEVCEAYMQILYMTGNEPEYEIAEEIPYTLKFSVKDITVESLEFDLSEAAEYIWYGSEDDGLIFYEVTGDFKINFKDINKTEKFEIPRSLFVQEEEEPAKAAEWKKAYIEYVTSLQDVDSLNGYSIQDINNDGRPELFIERPMTYGEAMIYVDGHGNARLNERGGVEGYSSETGIVWMVTGHGRIEESFCQYNEQNGQFEAVHSGSYEVAEETVYEFDGRQYSSFEEYREAVKKVFDTDNYMQVQFTEFSDGNKTEELIDAIQNY